MERNSLLLLQHREGILSAYLKQTELEDAAHRSLDWSDSPRKGVEFLWNTESEELRLLKSLGSSDLRSIKILDSFFSDTLTDRDIRIPIFKRAIQGVPVRFLLAHPNGAFGKARAEAIGQSAAFRSFEGLQRLARACNQVRMHAGHWKSLEKEIDSTERMRWSHIASLLAKAIEGLPVEIRLYQNSPVGPLYFFSDLLFAGRFWVDSTAANLPWEHVIDTPLRGDLYDIMLNEFHAVWDTASPLEDIIKERSISTPLKVFVSCCSADKVIVLDLASKFAEHGELPYVFFTDMKAAQDWGQTLQDELRSSDVLVAVISEDSAAQSDWIRAEIGAAWVLDKLVVKAEVGLKRKVLPEILDVRWAKNISTNDGRNQLVRDVREHFGRPASPSAHRVT